MSLNIFMGCIESAGMAHHMSSWGTQEYRIVYYSKIYEVSVVIRNTSDCKPYFHQMSINNTCVSKY